MLRALHLFGLFTICLTGGRGLAQTRLPASSLCDLQAQVVQGEHRTVRVEGVYLSGLEGQYLVAAGCSSGSTYIEFALKSHQLWKKLVRMSNESYKRRGGFGDGDPVLVVLGGEFYGPPVPDPRLPEQIRKAYHPGWNNNAMTKLVVNSIQNVEALPADHPCAPPKSDPRKWPCWQNPVTVH